MRVLVTGVGGFLGGAIAARLATRGDTHLATAARSPCATWPDASVFNLADRAAIRQALASLRPDVVVHAAGRTHGSAACLDADNAVATGNLAAALADTAPDAGLILLGSAAQYGRSATQRPWRETDPCAPAGAYGASKLAAETAAFAVAGLRVAALRVFNIVAAEPHGGQVLASFLRQAAVAPGPVEMGSLDAVRDFVALADVVAAVERVIEREAWGEAMNVCTGVGRPVRDLLAGVASEIGGVQIEESAGAGEQLDWSVGDPARCVERLGFTPSSDLTPVLGQAAAWVRDQIDARSGA